MPELNKLKAFFGQEAQKFTEAFVETLLRASKHHQVIWRQGIRPAMRSSAFPLILSEPAGSEAGSEKCFCISHVLFQEYFCASKLKLEMRHASMIVSARNETIQPVIKFAAAAALEGVQSVIRSDHFQVIVQMGLELLSSDRSMAEAFAGCFLSQSGQAAPPPASESAQTKAPALLRWAFVGVPRKRCSAGKVSPIVTLGMRFELLDALG